MPYYDRFDIVEAHYWWNVDHHGGQWSKEYERACCIGKYFSPGRASYGPGTENSKEIYNDLCDKAGCEHERIEVDE